MKAIFSRFRRNIDDYREFIKTKDLAKIDYLTELANRRGLYEYYNKMDRDKVAHIMFLDIDNFKRVNDIYGHSMGDKVLTLVSDIIKLNVKESYISRIGGDEFVVIINGHVSHDKVEKMARELIKQIEDIDFRRDILSLISLSVGIVLDQNVNQSLDEVLSKCDSAMYQAKSDGKNRYVIYKTMEKEIESNKNIELEMEEALERGDFKVYLQPKMNMISMRLVGAEALARWDHPIDGIRSPLQFIPVFEKNGFIAKLDIYIYEEVCKIKKEMKDFSFGNIPISVNMSRVHLYHKNFPDVLEDIARKYDVSPEELEIEITESVFLRDKIELLETVSNLKEKGFIVSIDDFGSGYSALNLLKDIPVDIIKIDKEFLKLSSDNIKGKKVIKNVINMCRDLKLEVVSEGIETMEQVDFVTSAGCEIAQGFYYSKPLPVDKFYEYAKEAWLEVCDLIEFPFNNSINSSDGKYTGEFIDDEGVGHFDYEDGVVKGQGSIRLYGGKHDTNLIDIPYKVLSTESYTICMWVKPAKLSSWTAVMYVKYEMGFLAIVPKAWDGTSDFRIRDSKEVTGWHDAQGCILWEGIWTHLSVTYNAKTETSSYYINGQLAGTATDVPSLRYAKRIYVGADVFQEAFEGNISELRIYSEAKSHKDIVDIFKSYTENKDFIYYDEIHKEK